MYSNTKYGYSGRHWQIYSIPTIFFLLPLRFFNLLFFPFLSFKKIWNDRFSDEFSLKWGQNDIEKLPFPFLLKLIWFIKLCLNIWNKNYVFIWKRLENLVDKKLDCFVLKGTHNGKTFLLFFCQFRIVIKIYGLKIFHAYVDRKVWFIFETSFKNVIETKKFEKCVLVDVKRSKQKSKSIFETF